MSHHPERTARNVRPVDQPPSFSKVVAMHVPGVQKRGLRGGCAAELAAPAAAEEQAKEVK